MAGRGFAAAPAGAVRFFRPPGSPAYPRHTASTASTASPTPTAAPEAGAAFGGRCGPGGSARCARRVRRARDVARAGRRRGERDRGGQRGDGRQRGDRGQCDVCGRAAALREAPPAATRRRPPRHCPARAPAPADRRAAARRCSRSQLLAATGRAPPSVALLTSWLQHARARTLKKRHWAARAACPARARPRQPSHSCHPGARCTG
jgi:hypothetical protein